MRATVARLAFPVSFFVLLAGIMVVGAFLAIVALPDMMRTGAATTPSPNVGSGANAAVSPAPSPSPTSPMALTPIGVAIPANADCGACHTISTSGVDVKPIPYLGHPLQGFADCTACHNPTGLVKTAPGHSSIHANECLICHQENPNLTSMSQIPMRPEHMTGEACTNCHNPSQHAPLPSAMANRGDNCWICHNGPEFEYLFSSASPGASAVPAATPSAQPPTGYLLQPPSPAP
jgi:hypothetical protein